MSDKRKQRRRRWARIHDYEAAVMAHLESLTMPPEPSDEDRDAAEAVDDERRERDDV